MNSKEKANWEVTLKNILYYIDNENEQAEMISILEEYNNKLPDNPIKDLIQKKILNSKKDYYSKVDYLVDDILSGKKTPERNKILNELLNKIKPVVEKAERTFWRKLYDLFSWS